MNKTESRFIVVGIKVIDGEPQLAGECVSIVADSEEQAIEVFMLDKDPEEGVEWSVTAQEDTRP